MDNLEDYNDEPVFYCKSCLSLRIKAVSTWQDLDYCDECGSTDVAQTDIETWRSLYKKRYGFDYLTEELNNNGRDKKRNYH